MSVQIALTSLAFFAAAILAGVMGFAIQRGARDWFLRRLRQCGLSFGACRAAETALRLAGFAGIVLGCRPVRGLDALALGHDALYGTADGVHVEGVAALAP